MTTNGPDQTVAGMGMSDEKLKILYKRNFDRLVNRVNDVLYEKKPRQKVLLAMDFDECAIEQHLSRLVTETYQHRSNVNETDKYLPGIRAIANLLHCYVGLKQPEFVGQIKQLAASVIWKEGFLDFLGAVQSRGDIMPVFISSGLTQAVVAALEVQGIIEVSVIADDLEVEDNLIVGPYTIVGDEEKGMIVKQLVNLGRFEKCITVGHSDGDVNLIKEGSPGYKYSVNGSDQANSVADRVVHSWFEITID